MATYKESVGTTVVNFAGNNPGAVEGQLWYDSTNKDFKYQHPNVTTSGAWATTNSLNTARQQLGGAGSQTQALAIGGTTGSVTGATEQWAGSSWTEVNDLNTARRLQTGRGTYTSALAMGGFVPPQTAIVESWNGTNWTETTDLNTAKYGLGSAGADNTSVLVFGGYDGSSYQTQTESWNGSNWTEVNDMNTGRGTGGSTGTVTSALYYGGEHPPKANTESWNGTNWTEVND